MASGMETWVHSFQDESGKNEMFEIWDGFGVTKQNERIRSTLRLHAFVMGACENHRSLRMRLGERSPNCLIWPVTKNLIRPISMVQTALTMKQGEHFLPRFRSQNSWLSLVQWQEVVGTNLASLQLLSQVISDDKCISPQNLGMIGHCTCWHLRTAGLCCMHQDQTKSCGKHIFPQLGLAAAEKQNSDNCPEHRIFANQTNPPVFPKITLLGSNFQACIYICIYTVHICIQHVLKTYFTKCPKNILL